MTNSPGLTLFSFAASAVPEPQMDRPSRHRQTQEIIAKNVVLVSTPNNPLFVMRAGIRVSPHYYHVKQSYATLKSDRLKSENLKRKDKVEEEESRKRRGRCGMDP
jgi:hypothetical protein